jgi:hypothetical protein
MYYDIPSSGDSFLLTGAGQEFILGLAKLYIVVYSIEALESVLSSVLRGKVYPRQNIKMFADMVCRYQ